MVYPNVPAPVTTTLPATAPPKEGWKTTEFWLTAASQLVAGLVFMKALPSGDADKLRTGLEQFIPAAMVALASGAGLVAYIVSRFKVKSQPTVIVPVPVAPAVTPAPLPAPPVFTPPTPEPAPPPTVVLPPAPAPADKPVSPAWIPDRTGEVLR